MVPKPPALVVLGVDGAQRAMDTFCLDLLTGRLTPPECLRLWLSIPPVPWGSRAATVDLSARWGQQSWGTGKSRLKVPLKSRRLIVGRLTNAGIAMSRPLND